ncbi:hypothetical protein DPMN_104023 [Dreissena polymorpha]|uniref:Uncharacterized protein n=1 Tax=Dreissena polymorpha TaxID=45954 RepID=A0A9D4HC79_DREPO|nr:hypothetical protein DPMN_104023 [Dreissena polymorpha]
MDIKNDPTFGIETVTFRSLGGHRIHYSTVTQDCESAVRQMHHPPCADVLNVSIS